MKTCCRCNESLSTSLDTMDILGAWKTRWGIGRMTYTINPGLYSVGCPDQYSPVLVTSNYKLTVDKVRKNLSGRNLWVLVLDTKGINVWCAAGKGTFGTEELIARIDQEGLKEKVVHRELILPQLGATGVSAHEIKKRSGFKVEYGPVRAENIPYFLDNGKRLNPSMREVSFPLFDRLVLTPVEIVIAMDLMLRVFGVMAILSALGILPVERADYLGLIGAVITGTFLSPLLLPWIPGRAFSFKGMLTGLIWAVSYILFLYSKGYTGSLQLFSYLLILPSLSAFFSMNFTGSSTYTSLSGVEKEIKTALPIILAALVAGILTRIISLF
ncbi:MAG: mercury methylation corrinoid protein HgcA [Synergistaceae bacterium]|nr:mercury methylation corrinoid protein HgcA [Synergistaceae bacterium]